MNFAGNVICYIDSVVHEQFKNNFLNKIKNTRSSHCIPKWCMVYKMYITFFFDISKINLENCIARKSYNEAFQIGKLHIFFNLKRNINIETNRNIYHSKCLCHLSSNLYVFDTKQKSLK